MRTGFFFYHNFYFISALEKLKPQSHFTAIVAFSTLLINLIKQIDFLY